MRTLSSSEGDILNKPLLLMLLSQLMSSIYLMCALLQFVKMELCGTKEKKKPMCMESEKSLKFHQMDPEITSTELWATWHENEGEQ